MISPATIKSLRAELAMFGDPAVMEVIRRLLDEGLRIEIAPTLPEFIPHVGRLTVSIVGFAGNDQFVNVVAYGEDVCSTTDDALGQVAAIPR